VPIVLLGLGSNIGDRMANLRQVVEQIASQFELIRAASVYETAPMYVVDQPAFLNSAAAIRTMRSPLDILSAMKAIERKSGREQGPRYGPREIDIDLLAYGSLRYRFVAGSTVRLQIPHPKIVERRFVLAPLADIAPDSELPGLGIVRDLLERTNEQASSVTRLSDALLPVQSHR
jgi:2-amino-4-hydroxy-6-hydroxymethyldihydropteridine diphosphokinase